eukprot:scaffold70270_cov30-Phaeocystis_antarctica.AAC.2
MGTSAAAWSSRVLPHQRLRQPDSALRALLLACRLNRQKNTLAGPPRAECRLLFTVHMQHVHNFYWLFTYALVTISLPPSSALLEASQLSHRCTSTYTNARRPSLKRGRPRLP